jgi:CMP-N,N'-diacetyllegionaminic acid synthase
MNVLGLIPARGGSKGLPGKNIRPMQGRPLIGWTIECARRAGIVTSIVVSTDDKEIAAVATAEGAPIPFVRPAEIAGDQTPMIDVIAHAIAFERDAGRAPDIVALLQPTSPLRSPRHVREAIEMLRNGDADSAVGVAPVPQHLCPDYVMKIEGGRLLNFLPEGANIRRRQDVRPAWFRDGTIYAFRTASFEKYGDIYGQACAPQEIEPERSGTIDTMEDFVEIDARMGKLLARGDFWS